MCERQPTSQKVFISMFPPRPGFGSVAFRNSISAFNAMSIHNQVSIAIVITIFVNHNSFCNHYRHATSSILTVLMSQITNKTSQELRMLSLSQAILDHKVILNNVVLNCQQCNQCLKCHM